MPIAPDLPPIERRTTVERVEERLREEILRGRFAAGTKLPPERELAASLGITRVTLRAALARLSASGLLATVQGDGHRVLDVRTHGGLERLPDMAAAFRSDATKVTSLISDLLGLRRVVMAEAAAACSDGDPAKLDALRACVDDMERSLRDHHAFVRADLAFGRTLLRLSGNLAFELTYNTMVTIAEAEPELMQVLYADRELILEAARSLPVLLAVRDPEFTRSTVREGLRALDDERLPRIAARVNPPSGTNDPAPPEAATKGPTT